MPALTLHGLGHLSWETRLSVHALFTRAVACIVTSAMIPILYRLLHAMTILEVQTRI